MTANDNISSVDGKTLIGYRWDLTARGVVRTYTLSQAHGQALPALGTNDLQAWTEPLDLHRTTLRVENLSAVTLTDKQLGTEWSTLQRFADEWTVTKTRQSATSLTAGSFLVGDSRVEQDFAASWARDTITVSAWVARQRTEYDNVLGEPITVIETVVEPASSTPSATGLKTYERRNVDSWHDLLTEFRVGDGSTTWSRTHYTTQPYAFPAVLSGLVLGNGFDQHNLRSLFTLNATVRQAFSLNVIHKHIDTLVSSTEAAVLAVSTPSGDGTTTQLAALVQPVPKDLFYSGYLFNLQVNNVLCDDDDTYTGGGPLTATTNSLDMYYGSGSETFAFSATSLSATAYSALVSGALWQPIDDTLIPWRNGYFIRRRTFIKFL